MKKHQSSTRPNTRRTAKTPSEVSSRAADRPYRGRNLLALIVLVILFVLFAYTRRDLLRERWLETQPMQRLGELDGRRDADTLVHFIYASRLVDIGAGPVAVAPITHAVDSLAPTTSPALAGRVLALAGYVAAQTNQNHQAEMWLQHAAILRRDDPLVYLGLGILATHKNQVAAAVAALTVATRLAPGRAEAWRRLGAAYLLGAEPERAAEMARHAVTLTPRDPEVHAELARALRSSKRYGESAAECRVAAALAPGNLEYAALPAVDAANAARTEAEFQQAERLLRAALDVRPQDDRLRGVLACLFLRFGEWAAARRELETCVTHNPEYAIDWNNLAVACTRLGDGNAAAAAEARYRKLVDFVIGTSELKKQVLLHRNDPAVFLRLADVCRRAGKYREAAVALEQAQRLRPDEPQIGRDLNQVRASLHGAEASTVQYPDGAEQN